MIAGHFAGANNFEKLARCFVQATRVASHGDDNDSALTSSAIKLSNQQQRSAFAGWCWVPPRKMRVSGAYTAGFLCKNDSIVVSDEDICKSLGHFAGSSSSSDSDDYAIEDEDECCADTGVRGTSRLPFVLRVTYSIAYHQIYRVPIMCFRFSQRDGRPINLMGRGPDSHLLNPLALAARILTPFRHSKPEILAPSPPVDSTKKIDNDDANPAPLPLSTDDANPPPLPLSTDDAVHTHTNSKPKTPSKPVTQPTHHRLQTEITVDSHPADGLPCFVIHPCQTHEAMQELRGSPRGCGWSNSSSSNSPRGYGSLYLLRWLCLVSPLVGLNFAATDYVRLSNQLMKQSHPANANTSTKSNLNPKP